MGIGVWSSRSEMHIAKDQQDNALKALQLFHKTSDLYLYGDNQAVENASSLKEALSAWAIETEVDDKGGLYRFEYCGDKGDFSPIMPVIAPYMTSGSVFEMAMENETSNYITEFTFNDKGLQTQEFLEYDDDYRTPVENKTSTDQSIDWYSEQLHFNYSGSMYRIVSWKAVDDVLKKAKKQVAKGLKYGKDSADFLVWDYEYNQGVLAEKIHKEIKSDSGTLELVITENRYDALCLNTPNIAFIDLDCPKNTSIESYKEVIQASVADYFSAHKDQSGILYETAEGMRLVFTHQLMTVKEAQQQGLFDLSYCDPRYVKMCLIQACFRARLTAKPWRKEKAKNKGKTTAVCRKTAEFNKQNRIDSKELNTVIELHDKYCLEENANVLA